MHRSVWSARASDGASRAKDSAPHWGKRPRAIFTSTSQVNKLQTAVKHQCCDVSHVSGLSHRIDSYRFHAFFYHTTMVLMWNWTHEFCLLISNYTSCCKLKCSINCMCMHYMNLNTQLLFFVVAARFASCESPKWFWTVDQNLTSPQTDVLLVGRHFSPSNGFGSVPIWFENSLLFDLNSERRDLAWLTCRRCSCSLSVGRKGADFKPLWTLFALLKRVRWSEAWRVF